MTTPDSTRPLLHWLDPLTDPARMRLLSLLDTQELSVGELASSLQLPQSTVSRHLKRLLEADWVVRRSEGTAAMYRRASSNLDDVARELWELARRDCAADPQCGEDARRAAEVIARRRVDSRRFFGQVGGEWADLRQELFGADLTTEGLLGLLEPGWTVADLGCGTGITAATLAPWVGTIHAVDREPAMLEAARVRLEGFDNVQFHQADLTALSLDEGSVDAAMLSLVLHHVPEPEQVVCEAARILRPGGRLVILDMVEHDREAYRDTMGHLHLGFSEQVVDGWCSSTGLVCARYSRLRAAPEASGPPLFAATLIK